MRTPRRTASTLSAALLCVAGTLTTPGAIAQELTVTSFGGSYQDGQSKAQACLLEADRSAVAGPLERQEFAQAFHGAPPSTAVVVRPRPRRMAGPAGAILSCGAHHRASRERRPTCTPGYDGRPR